MSESQNLYIILCLFSLGCLEVSQGQGINYAIPSMGHDPSFIPYDAKFDEPDFIICDSTGLSSGRNRLQYIGGNGKLRQDILSNFSYKHEYKSFNGFIVVRFLVNCDGRSGRYRAQSLNFDFSPTDAPSSLLKNTLDLIKRLDTWQKSSRGESDQEYSKYINLKFKDGKIQHVIL